MSPATNPDQLFVKSYFAASVQQAIEQARKEMGPHALLLDTCEAPAEARQLGRYEVIFGIGPASPARPQPAPPPSPAGGATDDLRLCVDEIRNVLARFAAQPRRDVLIEDALAAAGVEPALAHSMEEAVRRRLGRGPVLDIARPRGADPSPESISMATAEEFEARFEVSPEVGRVTALVGPPGAGKTTTLVKLAVDRGIAAGRPVRLISADTQRIGTAEQLAAYAAILGVPFQAVPNTAALAQAIDAAPAQALVLIDTPGWSGALVAELGGELANFLTQRQEIDTHLVLTASTRAADLAAAADRFEAFRPSKLLFTRMDETTSYAAVFGEAARRGKPLSFFGNGQSIPEDLAPASKALVVDALVRQLPELLKAVA